jgi:hypothetical protein
VETDLELNCMPFAASQSQFSLTKIRLKQYKS